MKDGSIARSTRRCVAVPDVEMRFTRAVQPAEATRARLKVAELGPRLRDIGGG